MEPDHKAIQKQYEKDYELATEDEVRVDAVVKCHHHTMCHDCGRFLEKELWVPHDHKWKKHALCKQCLSDYDTFLWG